MLVPNEPGPGYRPCLILALAEAPHAAETGRAFRRLGWDVYTAQSGPEARRLARLLEAEVVVLDVALPDETGWLTCAKLHAERPSVAILLFTDTAGPHDRARAAFVGALALF